MNQNTLTRLDWVIEAVEKAPPRQFNMDYWQHHRWFCGASHCAIGWACQDERVRASGLTLPGRSGFFVMPRFGYHTGFDAIATWLDIPESDVNQLFGPRLRSGKSKEEVLKRLKAYRDQVRCELAKQAPQGRQAQPAPISMQREQTASAPQAQQAPPASLAAQLEQAMQAPQGQDAPIAAQQEQTAQAPQDAPAAEAEAEPCVF